MNKIEELKKSVNRVMSLLDDPQPGLASWYEFLEEGVKEIGEICNERNEKILQSIEMKFSVVVSFARNLQNIIRNTGTEDSKRLLESTKKDCLKMYNGDIAGLFKGGK